VYIGTSFWQYVSTRYGILQANNKKVITVLYAVVLEVINALVPNAL
jgi:uncharacterized lipoprotein YajG